jgi:hypothetical protein
MKPQTASAGNHPGVIDYKGSSYIFGFNAALPGGGNQRRSVCLEKFTYNADGTIPIIQWTKSGPPQVGTLNPYSRTEAETICWESGVKTEKDNKTGVYVTNINNGDYIKVSGADFGNGAKSFEAGAASASGGGNIEIRLDSLNGTLVGTCNVRNTGGWQSWVSRSCPVKKVKGIHDVYFVFAGGQGDLFNFDWWRFSTNKK